MGQFEGGGGDEAVVRERFDGGGVNLTDKPNHVNGKLVIHVIFIGISMRGNLLCRRYINKIIGDTYFSGLRGIFK